MNPFLCSWGLKIFCSIALFSTLLLGCASIDDTNVRLGANAYNQKNYDLAAKYWNDPAKKGNYFAQYNIGLLWEQGLGSTPLNKSEASQWFLLSAQQGYVPAMVRLARIQKEYGYEKPAIAWFDLAARWGNQEAILELQSWNKTVPPADLLAAQQQGQKAAQQQRQKSSQSVSEAILLGLIQGVSDGLEDRNNSRDSSSYNSYQSSPPINTYQSNTYNNSLKKINKQDSEYKYKSSTGTQYKYDLSKPDDRLKYGVDVDAQLNDNINMKTNPNVNIDRNMNQYGGGVED